MGVSQLATFMKKTVPNGTSNVSIKKECQEFQDVNLKDDDMMTVEYSRIALRKCLELNDKQMIILSTLGGNDIVRRDEVYQFQKRNQFLHDRKFLLLADYIKTCLPMKLNPLIYTIAKEVLNDERPETMDRIRESFEQYNIKFEDIDYSVSNPLLHFCVENKLKFCLKGLMRFDLKKTVNEIMEKHFKYFPNYNYVLVAYKRKLCGIFFQHNRSDEVFEENYKPIYPDATVPPLVELLNRDEHPEHDELRFKLLKWLISDELLAPHDLGLIPKKYLLHILALVFMTTHGFITITEADLILFTIRQVHLDKVPIDLEAPDIINSRAYRISIQFNKLSAQMMHSLEFSGLFNSIERHSEFDGVFFNVKYLESGFNPIDHLDDLKSYRLYAPNL